MEPTEVQFNSFKEDFLHLEITCQEVFTEVLIDNFEVTISKEPVLVLKNNGESLLDFIKRFSNIREEIELNLTLHDADAIKPYVAEIKNFFLHCDNLIKEDKKGQLICNTFRLLKIPKGLYSNKEYPSYQDFLKEMKVTLRKEISYLNHRLNLLDGKPDAIGVPTVIAPNNHNLTWNRNINDLVELVKALKLSGAINNSSNNLTLDEAYRFFGNLFGIEIKRPEDQLRQKAELMKKLFFLEELNEVFQKDMKELMKRRMQ